MGIKDFLRKTKIESKTNISAYKNHKIAVDAYSWLHKSLYHSGEQVYFEKNITGIFNYFRTKLNKMFSLNIKVVLVFDGDNLSLKNDTETNRDQNRKKTLAKIDGLKKQGNDQEARRLYSSAIDVTPEMAYALKVKLQQEFPFNLEFLVAPYEADSQLAYLSMSGYVDLIISEDSDLLIFGAKKVFYKMDNEFNGDEIILENLQNCNEFNFKDWNHNQIISFAILCGCDYLESPKGSAFVTAYKIFSKTRKIEDFLIEMEGKLEENYFEKFVCAFLSFKYQNVYCPIEKKLKTLNKFDEKDQKYKLIALKYFKSYSFLGGYKSPEILEKHVNFKIDPITQILFPNITQFIIKNSRASVKNKRIVSKISESKPKSVRLSFLPNLNLKLETKSPKKIESNISFKFFEEVDFEKWKHSSFTNQLEKTSVKKRKSWEMFKDSKINVNRENGENEGFADEETKDIAPLIENKFKSLKNFKSIKSALITFRDI